MTDTNPAVAVYHGARHILASGGVIVTYGAPPLVLAVDSDVLVVALDLYVPLRRADGFMAGARSGPNSVAPDAPLTREIGGCTISVKLSPVDHAERSLIAPTFSGRVGPTSWHLTWEVSQDAPGMMIAAEPEPAWRLPDPESRPFDVSNAWQTPAHLLNPVIPA